MKRFTTTASIRSASAKVAVLTVTTKTTDEANIQRTEIALGRKVIAQLCEEGQRWMLDNPLSEDAREGE